MNSLVKLIKFCREKRWKLRVIPVLNAEDRIFYAIEIEDIDNYMPYGCSSIIWDGQGPSIIITAQQALTELAAN